MKKYRLIKEYPGSPKLDTIVKQTKNSLICIDDGNRFIVMLDVLQQYKEFWEEVVEKDYEILSFQLKDRLYTLNNKQSNIYCSGHIGDCICLSHYKQDDYQIHSIKRLSDGEIFTIGDNTKYGCIDKFYIKRDYLLATTVLESFGRHLNHLEKIKQPLFKTEDGVDIYEGNYYYNINCLINQSRIKATPSHTKTFNTINHNKCFSTKEKAEEYILMNKPCLSLNDIHNKLTLDYYNLEWIKELVKQKIK